MPDHHGTQVKRNRLSANSQSFTQARVARVDAQQLEGGEMTTNIKIARQLRGIEVEESGTKSEVMESVWLWDKQD